MLTKTKYSVYLQLASILLIVTTTQIAPQALPNCLDKCGNISIPYPFGMTLGCFRNERFEVTCADNNKLPQPFLVNNNTDIPVSNISIDDAIVIAQSHIATDCYNTIGVNIHRHWIHLIVSEPFSFSSKRNKFTVVGCDTYAYIEGYGVDALSVGCVTRCNSTRRLVNGSCSGYGCCQTAIPEGLRQFSIWSYSFENHTGVHDFNPCGQAFLVEANSYNFSIANLAVDFTILNEIKVPVVLDWVIDNITCKDAANDLSSFACNGNHSKCYDVKNPDGYRCKCSDGFNGNPYLPNGCTDIDECKNKSLHDCTQICNNFDGGYSCSCRKGYKRDQDNQCIREVSTLPTMMIAGVCVSLVLLAALGVCFVWKMRENEFKRREKYYQQNGGLLLQKKLGGKSSEGRAKIFTLKELMAATNNFSDNMIIGKGGVGTVYKGILSENRAVAIKKSKVASQIQSEQFANEFILLTSIDHPNIVKLVGCCLESEVPLLVYEFITNGTLSRHIHNGDHDRKMTWVTRLHVASQTAGALAHLHTESIVHRDVKPCNILIDENNNAKVSDFGDSRLIPFGETQLDTHVKGTFGYIDPEYFSTGQLTEKSDVYNFGVVLLELLTGERPSNPLRGKGKQSLVFHFLSSLGQNHFFQILDMKVAQEWPCQPIKEVAKIAERCLKPSGEERPTMKEVARELEELVRIEECRYTEFEMNSNDTNRTLVHESMNEIYSIAGTSLIGRQEESFAEQDVWSLETYGRGR